MQEGSYRRCCAPTVLRRGKGTHAGDGVPPVRNRRAVELDPATMELQAAGAKQQPASGGAGTDKRRGWNQQMAELELAGEEVAIGKAKVATCKWRSWK